MTDNELTDRLGDIDTKIGNLIQVVNSLAEMLVAQQSAARWDRVQRLRAVQSSTEQSRSRRWAGGH